MFLAAFTTYMAFAGETVDFNDGKHLKKAFRRRFGCTMRQYRANPESAERCKTETIAPLRCTDRF